MQITQTCLTHPKLIEAVAYADRQGSIVAPPSQPATPPFRETSLFAVLSTCHNLTCPSPTLAICGRAISLPHF
ncbi:hypothetical protein HNQ59_001237 [Chitinivorax tropicus]|uniref:Uncharacterized protein n=1 Tax=Chitinivorax tropicus TaxID=714531 RepID=A0A840MMK2_9PROT|nr:hypothetical protein [Chitinivorax tropicus]MBB5017952.1 hypothetical protein [Chitinivorax tropicus]